MTATGGVSGGGGPVGGNVGVNSYHCPAPAPIAIHESEFERMVCTVRNRHFDSDRLSVAKQAVGGRWITTGMVIRMMHLFSFESTRLDFAKYAYLMTIDKHQYYLVNDAFSFSSSARELDAYIRNI
jgi:hypothetical protein